MYLPNIMIGNASSRPQETNLQVMLGRYSDSKFNISFNSSHPNFKFLSIYIIILVHINVIYFFKKINLVNPRRSLK